MLGLEKNWQFTMYFFRVRYFYEVLNKENKIVYVCIFLLGD